MEIRMIKKAAFLLSAVLLSILSACGSGKSSVSPDVIFYDNKNISAAETTVVLKNLAESEISLIKDIYAEFYQCSEEQAKEYIGFLKENKEYYDYSDRILGKIESEDDAEEKGKSILYEILSEEFIADIESDYVEINGEMKKIIRNNPPYSVRYLENFDVWTISPVCKSGKTEDGINFFTPSNAMPTVVIGASDGKVLAIMHG